MKHVSMLFSYLILLASITMLCWGVLGFLEYFFDIVLFIPLQNASFPSGTQFFHWLIITLSGTVYLVGYFTRWKFTPIAMMILFSMLATMCFIQTFDFMTNDSRYFDLAREVLYYIVMSVYLVKSRRMQEHYGRIDIKQVSS
ncbi:MAG: hypothetical protein QNJ69_03585 [Gammaproteobacteria bacterium]|nr:hypothetical protein [Gammaproteobacteria bacterium]